MRVNNKGGFSPYGRRLGRGLVALVALSAICLSASTARATTYTFIVDPFQSSLGFIQFFGIHADNTGADGLPYPHWVAGDLALAMHPISAADNYGNPDPSNVAPLTGWFNASINTGVSIKIGASSIVPANVFPYFPYETAGAIRAPPGGVGVGGVANALAQYGLEVYGAGGVGLDAVVTDFLSGGFGLGNIFGLTSAFGHMSTLIPDGGAAMPSAGGNNYTASDFGLINTTGTEDIFSGAIVTSAGISGVPSPIGFGINATTQNVVFDPRNWTITIPLDNRITFVDSGTLYDIRTFGTLVAHAYPAEPSSMVLLLCGAVGLIGYAVRRKGRA